ncbi:MAG: hypothetical protein FRX49_08997 [Trebouxia sp. A1-2]|nr:MAG: hypothetical protein FRX49_08997 [Trebouxia sp. A1-2]
MLGFATNRSTLRPIFTLDLLKRTVQRSLICGNTSTSLEQGNADRSEIGLLLALKIGELPCCAKNMEQAAAMKGQCMLACTSGQEALSLSRAQYDTMF